MKKILVAALGACFVAGCAADAADPQPTVTKSENEALVAVTEVRGDEALTTVTTKADARQVETIAWTFSDSRAHLKITRDINGSPITHEGDIPPYKPSPEEMNQDAFYASTLPEPSAPSAPAAGGLQTKSFMSDCMALGYSNGTCYVALVMSLF